MKIKPSLKLDGVYVIEPNVFRDRRGYFYEMFKADTFNKEIGTFLVTQENQSKSKRGVLRGLHFQRPPYTQAKLVQVVKGMVLDVIVDIRTDSPTFGQHMSIVLDGLNKRQLFIPRGFAHGFITLSKNAIFQYKVDNDYAPKYEDGIIYDDHDLNIDWRAMYKVFVNEKDMELKKFDKVQFYTTHEYHEDPTQ